MSGEPTVAKGDVIRIIPERGPVRVMRVAHVEHHVITLAEACDCPQGCTYHAINCLVQPSALMHPED